MGFCKRCHSEFIKEWRKKNKDPRIKLNEKDIIFRCQIPIYDPDGHGHPRMRIWNCGTKQYDYYPLDIYNEKRLKGELP